ncbi:MAG TPA: extracellular solute-binding protein [Chloroflexota bacterium]|nr:extracellular solute-binding protein [Chloroflexota bacterium]
MARNTGQPWLVSRRYWLTGIGMAVGSGVLNLAVAACGSASTVSPTAASTPKPTVNAAAAAPAAPTASSAAPAATAPAKAALSGTFTTLGWGDIPYNQAMLDDYAKAFPDKVGNLKFTAEGAKSETEVLTKVLTAFAAKSGVPDFFQQNAPTVPQLIDQGIVAPLDALINPNKDVFSSGLLAALSKDGHPYAFPWRPNTWMMFYRKDLLSNAGIDPTSLTTWDAYIAAGKQYFSKTGGKSWLTYEPTNNGNGQPLEIFMDGLGISYVDPDGKPAAGNNPKMLQALESYQDFLTTKTAEARSEWDAPWYTAIKQGEFATMLSAVWLDNTLKGQAPELKGKWGIVPLPGYSAEKPTLGFQEGSPVLLVTTSSPFKDLAMDVMAYQYLTKDRVIAVAKQRIAQNKGAFPPLLTQVLAEAPFNVPDDYYGGINFFKTNLDLSKNGVTIAFNLHFAETLKTYNSHLDLISAGKETAQQAYDTIGKELAGKLGPGG